jgi:hypothetical protein
MDLTLTPAEAPRAASMAKAYCSDMYTRISADAIQVHGGIGFTWDHNMHLYRKRAKSSEVFLGNAAWHRERMATLIPSWHVPGLPAYLACSTETNGMDPPPTIHCGAVRVTIVAMTAVQTQGRVQPCR